MAETRAARVGDTTVTWVEPGIFLDVTVTVRKMDPPLDPNGRPFIALQAVINGREHRTIVMPAAAADQLLADLRDALD